jgi:hypothetical protein
MLLQRRADVLAPFVATSTLGMFDLYSTVRGGGQTGEPCILSTSAGLKTLPTVVFDVPYTCDTLSMLLLRLASCPTSLQLPPRARIVALPCCWSRDAVLACCRAGASAAAWHCARAAALSPGAPAGAQGGGTPDTGLSDCGAQEARQSEGPQVLPMGQALTQDSLASLVTKVGADAMQHQATTLRLSVSLAVYTLGQ